ncbi:O-succinylhomoserine sulfhydrylase [Teredinibacter turnerae T7901]|uniref:O-succinylhomoserine sulfhydrylase n=1 Tax=Teredinibacter turnerae (strain ATCC 39867 / T7901) TaxID=377629 RepID=C5BL51_TERTT|nr:O-succinylhomoserine sulfhydrylase [Teredinibacter turnerae]ACR13641.1 O-succinylhomoserine sulfhydrylase [Teredinibacter turnerae T7901]
MTDHHSDSFDFLAGAELDTLAVRAGQVRGPEGEHSEPIYTTSSFVFASAGQAAARFRGDDPGNVYSRYTNPTVRTFEDRIAALEGGEAGVATASGMAAILSTCMALLSAGDHVVCSRSVFGTTTVLFTKYLQKFGVQVDLVGLTDLAAWEQSLKPNTRLLFLETPSNPICDVADVRKLADLAHSNGCLLVVDNCFCTPALQKPLALGADIVVHSATKFLDGQGRCMGGAVVGRADQMAEVTAFLRTCGPTMSPFNAWVFVKGLETLRLRMEAHSASALALAQWLDEHPKVGKVNYAGLPEHPGHSLAVQQQSAFGGVLSFEVLPNTREAAWTVVDAARIMSLTANLGDAKTTIVHPATTTHGRLSDEERSAAGISEGLIRVAVGLESINDLKKDLDRGLSLL